MLKKNCFSCTKKPAVALPHKLIYLCVCLFDTCSGLIQWSGILFISPNNKAFPSLHVLFVLYSPFIYLTVCIGAGWYICAWCITDSINHLHVLRSEQWQSSNCTDEKLLPQPSWKSKADWFQSTGDWRLSKAGRINLRFGGLLCFFYVSFTTPT